MKLLTLLALGLLLAAIPAVQAQDGALPAFPDVKILIVIPEFHQGEFGLLDATAQADVTWTPENCHAGQPWLETRLIQRFVDAGYQVTDQSQYAFGRYSTQLQPVMEDTTAALPKALADNFGVDIVIVGPAMLAPDAPGANPATVQARAVLRAVSRLGEGQVLGTSSVATTGTDADLNTAAQTAAVAAADAAVAELMAGIGAATGGPTAPVAATNPGGTTPTTPDTTTPTTPTTPTGPLGIAVMPFDDQSGAASAAWDLGTRLPDLIAAEMAKTATRPIIARTTVTQAVQQQGWQGADIFNGTVPLKDLAAVLNADVAVCGRIMQCASTKVKRLIPLPGGARLGMERGQVRMQIKVVDLTSGAVLATKEIKSEATEAIIGDGAVLTDFDSAQFNKSAIGSATQKAVAAAAAAANAAVKAVPATCAACGAKVQPGDKFCPGCGAPVQATPAVCPKCKEPVQPGDKFCRKCGQALQQQ